MNNLTILINSIFAIILNHLLLFIRLLVDSSQLKFSEFQTQNVCHKCDLLKKIFCYSEYFAENKKDGNHLVQDLVNMLNGTEQTSLNLTFFLAWILLNVALYYHKEDQCFSDYQVWGIFLENFHIHVATVECISLQWVSDYNLKWIIPQ